MKLNNSSTCAVLFTVSMLIGIAPSSLQISTSDEVTRSNGRFPMIVDNEPETYIDFGNYSVSNKVDSGGDLYFQSVNESYSFILTASQIREMKDDIDSSKFALDAMQPRNLGRFLSGLGNILDAIELLIKIVDLIMQHLSWCCSGCSHKLRLGNPTLGNTLLYYQHFRVGGTFFGRTKKNCFCGEEGSGLKKKSDAL